MLKAGFEGGSAAIEPGRQPLLNYVAVLLLQLCMIESQCQPLLQLEPATQIVKKSYSLVPDMLSGWKPKFQLNGPVPLNFSHRLFDSLVRELQERKTAHYKLVYLGPRPTNTLELYLQHQGQYACRAENYSKSPQLQAFFRKFYDGFNAKEKRTTQGNLQPCGLQFDSSFQSGNLDVAIQVAEHEFDLVMRTDSNTKGHTQWFYFSVQADTHRRVKFNIVNFRKWKTLYMRGMRPYLRSHHPRKGQGWQQGGLQVSFAKKCIRYSFLHQDYRDEQLVFNQLSWSYQFQEGQKVEFCYCIPYTLSDQLDLIRSFPKKIVKQQQLTYSLGGVPIPLLTITQFDIKTKKKCVLILGRQHPGESNGSIMLSGFLKFLCSQAPEARQLRQKCVFKVVPMLNVDGVILGNYRTSAGGKDLNRLYLSRNLFLYPQVQALCRLVQDLKKDFKRRLEMMIDFHGHSVRKNAFFFGPHFGPWDSNYYRSKILPKLISEKTQMFRFYSCSFRLNPDKKATARAHFMPIIPFTYTLEVSNYSYYQASSKENHDFNQLSFELLGKHVGIALHQFYEVLQEERGRGKQPRKLQQDRPKEPPCQRQQQLIKSICRMQQSREQNSSDGMNESKADSESSGQDFNQDQAYNLERNVKIQQFEFDRSVSLPPAPLQITRIKPATKRIVRHRRLKFAVISCMKGRTQRQPSLRVDSMAAPLARQQQDRVERWDKRRVGQRSVHRVKDQSFSRVKADEFQSQLVIVRSRLPKLY